MTPTVWSWEDYFDPETYNPATESGTLRNLLGIKEAGVLRRAEYGIVQSREDELYEGHGGILRTYGADHLCAIHGYLFQDVYEWAGQFRTVNISKGWSGFADHSKGEIEEYLANVQYAVTELRWEDLDRERFGAAAALVFADLNHAHPFREGNGRASRVFMQHVAEQSRFDLDFARVDPELWNYASSMSAPLFGVGEPNPEPLIGVFQECAVERGTREREASRGQQVRSLYAATYPTSAAAAVQQPIEEAEPRAPHQLSQIRENPGSERDV